MNVRITDIMDWLAARGLLLAILLNAIATLMLSITVIRLGRAVVMQNEMLMRFLPLQ